MLMVHHIDVWACDMCMCVQAPVKSLMSRHPGDPPTHFCLALSLPSRLFLFERTRCDSMFPIAKQSCHSGLGICLISNGVRRCWWEKSTIYQMSLLSSALADRAPARTVRCYRQSGFSPQKDSLKRVMILIFNIEKLK